MLIYEVLTHGSVGSSIIGRVSCWLFPHHETLGELCGLSVFQLDPGKWDKCGFLSPMCSDKICGTSGRTGCT